MSQPGCFAAANRVSRLPEIGASGDVDRGHARDEGPDRLSLARLQEIGRQMPVNVGYEVDNLYIAGEKINRESQARENV